MTFRRNVDWSKSSVWKNSSLFEVNQKKKKKLQRYAIFGMSVCYVKSDDVYRRRGYEYDDKGTIKRVLSYIF